MLKIKKDNNGKKINKKTIIIVVIIAVLSAFGGNLGNDIYDGFKNRIRLPSSNFEQIEKHENKLSALVTMYSKSIQNDSLIFFYIANQSRIINKLVFQTDLNDSSITALKKIVEKNDINLASNY